MESTHLGVKGYVVDQDNQPIPDAQVKYNKLVEGVNAGYSE